MEEVVETNVGEKLKIEIVVEVLKKNLGTNEEEMCN